MEFIACTVEDIPAMGNASSPFAKLIIEFVNSNIPAAEIKPDPYGVNAAASTIRAMCCRSSMPVRVVQRQKRLFLIRTDMENKEGKDDV